MVVLFVLMGFLSGWGMMHGLIVPAGKYHSSGTVWGCPFKGKGNKLYWLMALAGFLLMILWIVLVAVTEDGSDYLWGAMIACLVGKAIVGFIIEHYAVGSQLEMVALGAVAIQRRHKGHIGDGGADMVGGVAFVAHPDPGIEAEANAH